MRLTCLVTLAALALSSCRIDTTNTNTATATTPLSPTPPGGTGTGGTGSSGTTAGPRTPDPPAGSILPLPAYGAVVLQALPNKDALVIESCTSSAYLDALLAALKARDTRWGRVCTSSACTALRGDSIGYHATAGPDVTGATGAHIVDVIQNFCTAPIAQWLILGYEGATALAF